MQVIIAVIYCLFAAGIVFGYAAIKPVLIREQVYRNLCTKKEIEDGVRVCYDQEVRLNFMFTVAAVGTNVAALPIGAILDNYGPRACGIIGSFFSLLEHCFLPLHGNYHLMGTYLAIYSLPLEDHSSSFPLSSSPMLSPSIQALS